MHCHHLIRSSSFLTGHPGATGGFGSYNPNISSYNPNNSSYNPSNSSYNPNNSSYNPNQNNNNNFTSSSSVDISKQSLSNPNFRDPRLDKTWIQTVSELASDAMKLNTKSNNGGSATSEVLFNQTYNSSSSSSNNNNNFNNNNGYNNSSSSNNNEFQFASNRGVHAIHSNSSTQYQPTIPSPISSSTTTTTLSQQFHHHHHHQSTAPSSSDRSSRVGDATSNSIYERTTIENLCVPGGLRPVPPENELQDFLTVAPTLSADIVGRYEDGFAVHDDDDVGDGRCYCYSYVDDYIFHHTSHLFRNITLYHHQQSYSITHMHLIAPIFILLNLSFYSGNCLLDMLNSDAWQSRVKALIVISKLIQSSSFDKVSIVINHFFVLKTVILSV